jgi:hypothetical protein
VAGAERGAVEGEEPTSLENAIDDGGGEVGVVQDAAPGIERLVGGEDHGATVQVAVVDDVEEDIGGVGAIGQVAHLVDDEDVGVGVGGQRLEQASFAACSPSRNSSLV